MGAKRLYREYDEDGSLIKLECSKCREIKTVNNYTKRKNYKDGYYIMCKLCLKEYYKQYKIENKEKITKHKRQYYQENKEKRKEYSRQHYQENKEKMNEYSRQHYQENKEKIAEYSRQHYQENKEKRKEHDRQYYQENKEKIAKHKRQYHENKIYKEMFKIYENVTKNLYPNNGIQYGIIYGVHCKVTDRWYIGQTVRSFNIRYQGDFFKYKTYELYDDNTKAHLLQYDIEKYGQENFEIFEVLDVAFSEKELDEKETYYIDLYKAYDEGYNSNRGNIFKHNKLKRKEVI